MWPSRPRLGMNALCLRHPKQIVWPSRPRLGMTSLFRVFPRAVQKSVILLSAALGALLFVVVDLLLIQAIYREMTIFHARSGSLGVPVWIYYAGVPLFSCFVFRGIWRGACSSLRAPSGKGSA